MRVPAIDRISFLVGRKFPGLNALLLDDHIRKQLQLPILLPHEKAKLEPAKSDTIEAIEKYRAELSELDELELEELYEQALNKKNLEDDRARFFNDKSAAADYDYWSKMSHWTLEEAIALSFGKNPEIVFSKRLESLSSHQSPFVHDYRKLNELARRATIWKKLFDPVLPALFVTWARENDIAFPEVLAEKVIQRHTDFVDWKQKYSDLLGDYKKQSSDFSSYIERATYLLEDHQKQNPESHENISYIPPYVSFMHQAVKDLNLSPDSKANRDVIIDWLTDNWPADLEGKSKRLIQAMATLLRRPEDKKGGNSPWK